MTFEFYSPCKIIFGNGTFTKLPELIKQSGNNPLIITGGKSLETTKHFSEFITTLKTQNQTFEIIKVDSEPTVSMVNNAVAKANKLSIDSVCAIGGGSVIDLGKAVAGILTNGGEVIDYLEGVGAGKEIEKPALPFIAVPTTSGTGTEVTRNAVISDDAKTFKKSMRSEYLIPKIALVDPQLTCQMPPAVTAHCGFDALTQLIESYTSPRTNPIMEALALSGIERTVWALKRAWQNGNDAKAREAMAYASLLSGICLAQTGLGAVHGMASPLGAFYKIPHGLICAVLLPPVIHENYLAMQSREPQNPAIEKYQHIAKLFCHGSTDVLELVATLQKMLTEMKVPKLKTFGLTENDFPKIVAASQGNSMKTNPLPLTDTELTNALITATGN